MSFVVVGEAIGVAVAYWLSDYIRAALFDVTPTDTTTFVSVGVVLFLVALAACYVPARRASRVDPMVALRQE